MDIVHAVSDVGYRPRSGDPPKNGGDEYAAYPIKHFSSFLGVRQWPSVIRDPMKSRASAKARPHHMAIASRAAHDAHTREIVRANSISLSRRRSRSGTR